MKIKQRFILRKPTSRISTKDLHLRWSRQKTDKMEKLEVKKMKAKKADKEKNYELPEIPDYERPVLEKPQEFDFGEHVKRDKTKLERPATQVQYLQSSRCTRK